MRPFQLFLSFQVTDTCQKTKQDLAKGPVARHKNTHCGRDQTKKVDDPVTPRKWNMNSAPALSRFLCSLLISQKHWAKGTTGLFLLQNGMIVEENYLLQRYQCIKAPKNVYHQSICSMGIYFLAQVIKVNAWALRSLWSLGYFQGRRGVGGFFTIFNALYFPKSYADCQPYFLNQYTQLHRNGNQKKICFDVLTFFNFRFLCNCKYYNFESCFIHLTISYEYFALLNTFTKTFEWLILFSPGDKS